MLAPTQLIIPRTRTWNRILVALSAAAITFASGVEAPRVAAAAPTTAALAAAAAPDAGGSITEGVDPGAGQPADAGGSGNQLDPAATAIFSQVQIWPVLLALDLLAIGGFALLIRGRRSRRRLS